MAHIPLLLVLPLYVLCKLVTTECYTYASKPLFMSFSDLAALEANSHPTHFDDPNGNRTAGEHKRTVVVKCHRDSVEVVIKARFFGHRLPVEPRHLRLGPASVSQDHCTATLSGNGEFTIRAAVSECGTTVLYNNVLLYTPPLLPEAGVAIPVQCEYRRRYRVSSGALRPTWTPLISAQSALLHLDFHLRLMTDDWSDERKSSVYFLGDMVNIEASVDAANHLPLILYVHTCTATLTPDVDSYPRYSFIDHQGCFIDSLLTGSSSCFLPRVQDKLLQIQLEPFLFLQDHRHTVYVTCHLEAVPISEKDLMKKACSFISGRWRSVDGNDGVCESCGRDEVRGHTGRAKPAVHQSRHKRALWSKTKYRTNGITSVIWRLLFTQYPGIEAIPAFQYPYYHTI
uniref:Zona pellucida sperm-binding protein 3 n=1 Tax=Myripristis murdjan TaxID=586833 RepID=A0A667Z100_9TELE